MINFASNLNKMIDAGLGGPLDPPRTEVAVGHRVVYTEASGAVVNFETNVIAPIKKLRVTMEPIQEGTGDPSPDNIRSITGRESVTVKRTGKNLLEKPAVYYTTIGRNLSDCFFVKAGEYNFSVASVQNATSWRWGIMLKDKDGADLSDMGHRPNPYMTWNNPNGFWLGGSNTTSKSIVVNVVEDCYIRIVFAIGDTSASTVANDAQLELGNTATEYEAPQIQTATIQLGQTVYGGTVDVTTGVMTVDRAMVDLETLDWVIRNFGAQSGFVSYGLPGGKSISGSAGIMEQAVCSIYKIGTNGSLSVASNDIIAAVGAYYASGCNIYVRDSRFTDAATFKTAMQGEQLVYELATPLEITLDPATLSTIHGQNNVWSDAGDISLEYPYYEETEGY